MRIAFLTNNWFPPREGIARHIHEIARRLARRGHEPLIVAPGRPRDGFQRGEHCGIPLLRYPYLRLRPFHHRLARRHLQGWLDQGADGADMIHCHLPLLPPLRTDLPRMVTFHSPLLTDTAAIPEPGMVVRLIKANARLVSVEYEQSHIDAADRLIAVSQGVASELRRNYRVGRREIEVVTNGVDTRFFPLVASRRRGRGLLYVGRLSYRKGLSRLLHALRLLDDPRARLDIVGEGPLSKDLMALARRLGVEERVRFLGFLDRNQLRELLKRVGCLVNPADYESGPLTVLEALACGTPVVSTATGLAAEMGDAPPLRIAEATPAGLAQAITETLEQPGRTHDLVLAGRELMERRFDWEVVTDRLLETYLGGERRAA